MLSIILAICFLTLAGAVHLARENNTEPNKAIFLPSMLIGGLFSVSVLCSAGFGVVQGDVGMPNSISFRTGRLVPDKVPSDENS